ncbi:unnamed protein product [Cylindrotheca closterium]|uniref:guanylate cyclase n=1 Tax=Cylindrotheca closterium TaxID=2856 RepID=A0AAD2PXB3_9STRA|nr:unnamed protein product [Cylindrotheca closterium]
MYGLIFEVVEEWVIEKYGLNVWHNIKELAGNKRKDQTYLRREHYQDEELVDLIDAASDILKISVTSVLESFGRFIIMHHFANGYDELLKCQGSTLRQWLSNLNAMHDHVQRSFPGENFIAPIYWCEDCDEVEGSILLHYYTLRGTLLVPMTVGIVEQLASYHFNLEVKMVQLALQGQDGSSFTSWRISAVEESQKWKLSPHTSSQGNGENKPVSFDGVSLPDKCPFSGRALKRSNDSTNDEKSISPSGIEEVASVSSSSLSRPSDSDNDFSFSGQHLKELFPFHILVDQAFSVLQIGSKLPRLLEKSISQLEGLHISEIVQITRPVLGSSWDWKSLNKLSDQNFFLTPTTQTTSLQKKVSMADSTIRFQASIYRLSPTKVMFALTPHAQNVNELNRMGLMLTDLPLSSCQRDAVFLGEHVAQESDKAHKLDKLSKQLKSEKDLSNTLLNNMLPQKVAEDLRRGKTVEPTFHENVTLFFSDVVGFTAICDQVEPWDVIAMMNQLYSVMDFLASHFGLYKVETVGDAYLCASGLLNPDEYHAEKMANFALAVRECVQHVKSPVDGSPIQLRIGIHTGSCTSGVIGTLTPHYCLFGDMVNTASRHESTGMPGKIQCSSVLYSRLEHFSKMDIGQYIFSARGLVEMKGKGEHYTYWLESATEANTGVNEESLASLSRQVQGILATNSWKKRRYFGRGGILRNDADASDVSASGTSSHDGSTPSYTTEVSSSLLGSDDSVQNGDDFMDDEDDPMPRKTIIDFPQENGLQIPQPWGTIGSQKEKFPEEAIGKSLCRSLATCIQKEGERIRMVEDQLRAFVSSIAQIYDSSANETSLDHIAEVFRRANFLWEARDPNERSPYALGANPWDHFTLLFSAFIHRVKHTGSTNATLQSEKHLIAQMYEGQLSCQERRSVDFAFTLLEDEFGELYDEVTFGCPNFRSLVRKTVLSTDLENESTVHKMLGKCEKLNLMDCVDERQSRERNTANIGLILAVATVGQYTQSLDQFLQYIGEAYDKVTKASDSSSSESWYREQHMFMKYVLLPLIEEVTSVLPLSGYLEEGATENIAFWDKRGQEWMVSSRLKKAKLHRAIVGSAISNTSPSSCCTHSLSATSEGSSTSEYYLASQMVTEAESLSKVMARYERKYETVLGNLIALAYKGQARPMDLEHKGLSEVHKHFKEQEWYRSHADNDGVLLRL